jgi:hypothetical protein
MHGPSDGRSCLVRDGSADSVLLLFAAVVRRTGSQLVQDES